MPLSIYTYTFYPLYAIHYTLYAVPYTLYTILSTSIRYLYLYTGPRVVQLALPGAEGSGQGQLPLRAVRRLY